MSANPTISQLAQLCASNINLLEKGGVRFAGITPFTNGELIKLGEYDRVNPECGSFLPPSGMSHFFLWRVCAIRKDLCLGDVVKICVKDGFSLGNFRHLLELGVDPCFDLSSPVIALGAACKIERELHVPVMCGGIKSLDIRNMNYVYKTGTRFLCVMSLF